VNNLNYLHEITFQSDNNAVIVKYAKHSQSGQVWISPRCKSNVRPRLFV